MKWQVIYKDPYKAGYLIVVMKTQTLSELIRFFRDDEIISITRIMDE
jgi:hypothetical protein